MVGQVCSSDSEVLADPGFIPEEDDECELLGGELQRAIPSLPPASQGEDDLRTCVSAWTPMCPAGHRVNVEMGKKRGLNVEWDMRETES